jgi:hypothetical protein
MEVRYFGSNLFDKFFDAAKMTKEFIARAMCVMAQTKLGSSGYI